MTEATANVLHVTAAAQREFGEDYVVVTADGLKVKDCTGTKGLKFWKVNSRKFFAVPEDDLIAPVQKRRRRADTALDSLDFKDAMEGLKNDLRDEMSVLHGKLDKVFTLTQDSAIPAGLRILLHDALKCKICHSTPLKPPIIFAKCCKCIIGYEKCIDEWFEDGGLSKNYPGCNVPRGLAETMRLHGLDDLVMGLQGILGEDN